jgi:phage baseplate assembly protein W|tara:strand:- start:8160 stop:8588 length:429 start_codon:yes stop_codon:yes gene_type:complete
MAYSTSKNTSGSVQTQSSGLGFFRGTYKGFSTVAGVKSNQLYDIDLIKQDLMNHFYTRKGERVMNPNFGSIIWDMLYEPLDAANKDEIVEDCKVIIAKDPRVELQDLNVMEYESGLRINIGINILPYNKTATMLLNFERETI